MLGLKLRAPLLKHGAFSKHFVNSTAFHTASRHQFQIRNPTIHAVIRKLGTISKGVLIGYGVVFAVVVGGFAYIRFMIDRDEQPVPACWPTGARNLFRNALVQEMAGRPDLAMKYYDDTVAMLVKDVDISKQSAEWLAGYADLLARTGLVKMQNQSNTEIESGVQALEACISISFGQPGLKSKAYITLAWYFFNKDKSRARESKMLMEQAVREVISGDLERPQLSSSSRAREFQVSALQEYGKFLVATKDYKSALSTFLIAQRAIDSASVINNDGQYVARAIGNSDTLKCYSSVNKSYISETLWALKARQDAVAWAEKSYKESWPFSRDSKECGLCAKISSGNLSKMFKHLGNEQAAQKYKELSDTQVVISLNNDRKWFFS